MQKSAEKICQFNFLYKFVTAMINKNYKNNWWHQLILAAG